MPQTWYHGSMAIYLAPWCKPKIGTTRFGYVGVPLGPYLSWETNGAAMDRAWDALYEMYPDLQEILEVHGDNPDQARHRAIAEASIRWNGARERRVVGGPEELVHEMLKSQAMEEGSTP